MRKHVFASGIFLALLAAARADMTSLYPYQRTLEPAGTNHTGVAAVMLDGPAAAAWSNGATNFMVLDTQATSNAVPVRIRVTPLSNGAAEEVPVPVNVLSLETQTEGTVEMVLEKKNHAQQPTIFVLGSDSQDFHVVCAIQGSVDCVAWKSLVEPHGLFRMGSMNEARLALPTQDAIFFKVRLVRPSTEDRLQLIAVAGSAGSGDHSPDARLEDDVRLFELRQPDDGAPVEEDRVYPLVAGPVESTLTNEGTNSVCTFRSERLPIRSMGLDGGQITFHSPARVLGRNDSDTEWTELTHQDIYQFKVGGQDFRHMTLLFPQPQRFASYRLEVGASQGMLVTGLTAEARGPTVWLEFPYQSDHVYRLYYGGVASTISAGPATFEGAVTLLHMSAQENNPSFGKQEPEPEPKVVVQSPPTAVAFVQPPPEHLDVRRAQGRQQMLHVTLACVLFCWLWYLGRTFKEPRA